MEPFQPNGGHVLVDAVRKAGTTAIFAIHGVQIDPIFQACPDLDVALVDVRHEGSAGFAAEAFSRLTGTLGVAAVCPGPGLTNVLTSMTNAMLDRTAVIYVVGSTPESTLETNGLQVGIDHVAPRRTHQQVGVQGALGRSARPRRGSGDPHRDDGASGPCPARHPGRRPRRRRDVDRRPAAGPCSRGAQRGRRRCASRPPRERGPSGAVAGRCPERGRPRRVQRAPRGDRRSLLRRLRRDRRGRRRRRSVRGHAVSARSPSGRQASGRRARVGCALRLRHSGAARRGGRMGHDDPAGGQRRRRGRSFRSRGAGRHRGPGGDDSGARGQES